MLNAVKALGLSIILIAPSLFAGSNSCQSFYKESTTKIINGVRVKKNPKLTKANVAWEVSRIGLSEILEDVYGMENLIFYLGSTILAKEHMIVDGAGGGGKTFAFEKVFDAQLRGLERKDEDARKRFSEDLKTMIDEVKKMAEEQKDKDGDQAMRTFMIQCHEMLSQTVISGGPNAIKYARGEGYEIDLSKSLLSPKNKYAILDELDKAPASLQMSMLSILAEREAMEGNQLIKSMLETVVATSNATQGELIAQGSRHEIGGRKALLDRLAVKFHLVNVDANGVDGFLFIERTGKARGQKRYSVINLRGLHDILDRIEVSQQVLDAAVDIGVEIDKKYTTDLKAAQDAAKKTQQQTGFYPSFSGSTRSHMKVLPLLKSAFLMRQLVQGVPFESMQLKMVAKDLVGLAPALLQGGPDSFVSLSGRRINFLQYKETEADPEPMRFLRSNVKKSNPQNSDILADNSISTGHYDPATQIFSYVSINHGQMRRIYFDVRSKKLMIPNKEIATELGVDVNIDSVVFDGEEKIIRRLSDLNGRLFKLHQNSVEQSASLAKVQYKLTGEMAKYLDEPFSPLSTESRSQLTEVRTYHTEFLNILNATIARVSNLPQTRVNADAYLRMEEEFKEQGAALKKELETAIATHDEPRLLAASAASLKQAMREMSYKFKQSDSTIDSELKTMVTQVNLMLSGPPGSAKTMTLRLLANAELEWIDQAKVAKFIPILAKVIRSHMPEKGQIWVKQFHPQTTEGDVIGRLDIKALSEGGSYTFDRKGSMAATDVLFALLDEFEKCPPGVRTTTFSLMNERKFYDGDDKIISNIISVFVTTNATPGEFMIGMGEFSKAFPLYDRLQRKAFAFNKLPAQDLKHLYTMSYLKLKPVLHSPLFITPLVKLAENLHLKTSDKLLLSEIRNEFMVLAVERRNRERKMHLAQPKVFPSFFMQSRGESRRSWDSLLYNELPMTIQMNRIQQGEKFQRLLQPYSFELKDLESFAELFLTANFAYSIKAKYGLDGILSFEVVSNGLGDLQGRIDRHEEETIANIKWEADELVKIINTKVQNLLGQHLDQVKRNPNMYVTAFETRDARIEWLRRGGVSETDLKRYYP